MPCGRFSSFRKAMCSSCIEDMIENPDADVVDNYGNKLKRSWYHIIHFMTKPKTKCAVDWSNCHHDTKEALQAENDFTYLKKSFRDGMRMTGKADSLLNKNCMKCSILCISSTEAWQRWPMIEVEVYNMFDDTVGWVTHCHDAHLPFGWCRQWHSVVEESQEVWVEHCQENEEHAVEAENWQDVVILVGCGWWAYWWGFCRQLRAP